MTLTITDAITAKTLVLKHGEIKQLEFTYTDKTGAALDITSAVLTLTFKEDVDDTTIVHQLVDGSFTKAANVATVSLDTTAGTFEAHKKYVADIKATFGGLHNDISQTFYLELERAVNV